MLELWGVDVGLRGKGSVGAGLYWRDWGALGRCVWDALTDVTGMEPVCVITRNALFYGS